MANLDLSNIKEMITSSVKKITEDKDMLEKFKKDPAGTVEDVLGVKLPTETLEKVVDGVKAKVGVDAASDLLGKVKGLFGK